MTSISLDREALLPRIKERRNQLFAAGEELKKHFVGLDDIIDRVLKHIEVWYCMPELIRRPIIVCLWGMTGVGKTDLVRRLVSLLNFNDRFLEVQLTTKNGIYSSEISSLETLMDASSLESETAGILLLDEIQRFRSLSENGEAIFDYKFQDVWTLLSDGKFSAKIDTKTRIMDLLYRSMYSASFSSNDDEDDDDGPKVVKTKSKKRRPVKKRKYQTSYWEAQDIKQILDLEEPIMEVMTWDELKIIETTEKKLATADTFTGKDYSKLLIFISGNLDEAYSMAGDVSDADMSADVFHEHSKRIDFLKVKSALTRRFTPEQIARLGNSHIIYPSLSRESYLKIAIRNLSQVCAAVSEHCGISITYDESILEVIYRNGVFPTQGVRPLFSTIASMFESPLPIFLATALEQGADGILLSYNKATRSLVSTIKKRKIEVPVYGDLDVIRDQQNTSLARLIAIHESGHAVIYAALFGLAPTQITITTSHDKGEGFTGTHDIFHTKVSTRDFICMLLAGTVAEEKILGEANRSTGCQGDLASATRLAAVLVRECGMFDTLPATYNAAAVCNDANAEMYCYDEGNSTSSQITVILQEERERAQELLETHKALLLETIENLISIRVLDAENFAAVCEKFELKITVQSAEETVAPQKKLFGKVPKIGVFRKLAYKKGKSTTK